MITESFVTCSSLEGPYCPQINKKAIPREYLGLLPKQTGGNGPLPAPNVNPLAELINGGLLKAGDPTLRMFESVAEAIKAAAASGDVALMQALNRATMEANAAIQRHPTATADGETGGSQEAPGAAVTEWVVVDSRVERPDSAPFARDSIVASVQGVRRRAATASPPSAALRKLSERMKRQTAARKLGVQAGSPDDGSDDTAGDGDGGTTGGHISATNQGADDTSSAEFNFVIGDGTAVAINVDIGDAAKVDRGKLADGIYMALSHAIEQRRLSESLSQSEDANSEIASVDGLPESLNPAIIEPSRLRGAVDQLVADAFRHVRADHEVAGDEGDETN